ncbi:Uncharacterised protein [BD1-7 clade bacterium]|uniref:Spondin domain-containing protein n=1 Tax=BD1-7 clade bacterium TaxID=2029982 RepID=A0A5S9QPZ0_9GAMM|nr:Uncharacterised protein [BD1-7 clade bacterium]
MFSFVRSSILGCTCAALAITAPVNARTMTIEITNNMHGVYVTPQIAAAHKADYRLFQLGQPASEALRIMAETGYIGALNKNNPGPSGFLPDGSEANLDLNRNDVLDGQIPQDADQAVNLAGTNPSPPQILLSPGRTGMMTLALSPENTHLSLAAMVMPTNDGFIGIDSWKIPAGTGTWELSSPVYDAATEANTEVTHTNTANNHACNVALDESNGCPLGAVIPFHADAGNNGTGPFGSGGEPVTEDADTNPHIHVHRGNVGEVRPNLGDLNLVTHRWLNPAVKVVVRITDDNQ